MSVIIVTNEFNHSALPVAKLEFTNDEFAKKLYNELKTNPSAYSIQPGWIKKDNGDVELVEMSIVKNNLQKIE